jgi:hypothetical protein
MTKEERENATQELRLLLDVINARVTVPLYTQPIKNPVTKQMEEHIKGSVDISLFADQYSVDALKKLVLDRTNKFLANNEKIVDLAQAAKVYKKVEKEAADGVTN